MTLDAFFELAARDESAAREALAAAPGLAHLVEVAGDYQGGQAAPAIVHAAHRGLTPLVMDMIDAGADIASRGLGGGTPLHIAAWMGHSETVAALLERGAPLEASCVEYGGTPLLWAAHGFSDDGCYPKKDQLGAARLLLEAGANPATPNRAGHAPVDLVRTEAGNPMQALLESYATT